MMKRFLKKEVEKISYGLRLLKRILRKPSLFNNTVGRQENIKESNISAKLSMGWK